MSAGFVDLVVRYRDIDTGGGIMVEKIEGIVKNARGEDVDLVTPLPETDSEGVLYAMRDYDIRDASKFSGTFVTVEWRAERYGVILPLFDKRYDFPPVAPYAANKTVVIWSRRAMPNFDLFFDVIRRRKDLDDVVAGRSFGTFFIDDHPFENEFEARSYKYVLKPYKRTPGEIQPDGTDYTVEESAFEADRVFRTGQNLCLLEGSILDVAGTPIIFEDNRLEKGSIVFRINWRDRQQIQGSSILSPEDVYVPPTNEGMFSMALLWDALVEIMVPMIHFKARFVVPRLTRAGIGDLDLEILRER